MLSARFHETAMFDHDDLEVIMWCAQDAMEQWMGDTGQERLSYHEIQRAVIMQIELHVEASVNIVKISERS